MVASVILGIVSRYDNVKRKKDGDFIWLALFPWWLISGNEFAWNAKIGGNGDFPGGSGIKNQQPVQETQVQSLVPEGPTYHGAAKPRTTQLLSLCPRAQEPKLLKPSHSRACALQWKAATMRSPCTATREEPLLTAARESLRAATEIQHNRNT